MADDVTNLRKRVNYLERQVADLKDKYIELLESKLANGNRKSEFPKETSKRSEAELSDLQLLYLLKESRATNKQYAVTASQLKKAYGLNRTTKTVRTKLNDLELRGFINSIGQRPICFFLAPKGLQILERQQRSTIKPNL